MPIITQTAKNAISINRFDTGENITLEPEVPVDVDQETYDYLMQLRGFDPTGELTADFVNDEGKSLAEIQAESSEV